MPRKDNGAATINLGAGQQASLSQQGRELTMRNIDTLTLPDDKFGCSIVMIGSTRSGKTTLLNYLWKRHFDKYISCLMSGSRNSGSYKILEKSCICSDMFHGEVLKDMYLINHKTKNHYKFCCVIDDITDHKGDKETLKLFTIYRNSRISTILCAQATTMMSKTTRANINVVMLGRLNNDSEIEAVVKAYLTSFFPTRLYMAEKIALYRQLTDDYNWIVIDQVGNDVFRTKLSPNQVLI
jgi:GTPase SAR1 family protein